MRDASVLGESYVVVVGSSAGGIEALERLVGRLPPDFPAPIVIAQHANPDVPSHLAEILRRRTSLRIVSVEKGEEQLYPQTIYVAPASSNVAVRDDTVTSSVRAGEHPVPSIDALFMSAAASFGDRVIAVILTGMGTDGVAGVRAVRESGGTVLVQEPESAAFPALPAAIPLSHIDYTATLESLGPLLVTLTTGPSDGEISNPDVLRAFLTQIRTRTGIDFQQYRTPTIVRRLSRLMATAGCETLKDYLRHLAAHPEAYEKLVAAFLIKVTEFFRDPALYAHLRETVLPKIVEHARTNRAEIRLWSAGCATGEEAYSLAITMAELLGDDVESTPVRIFATDLDSNAIAFARRGIYPAGALKELPPALVAKYFARVDDAFQVKKRIRNLTVFGEYDLGQRAPFPRIDLVLCRNVLIYFTKELQQRTLGLFAFSLRVGGYLVLGKSETTSPLPQYFSTVEPTLRIFQRQGERLLIPAAATTKSGGFHERHFSRRTPMTLSPATRRQSGEMPAARWSLVDRLGAFLFESPLGVVLVDRNYDISTINQAARAMLGIHGQGIGEDLIHLADVPSLELKAVLDAAFREEDSGVNRQLEVHNVANETRFLNISCYPDRSINKDGRIEGLFVLVTDATEVTTTLRRLEVQGRESDAAANRLAAQNTELHDRQRSLVEANQQLVLANAELRSTNEHLLISAEEAEAAAEEVETLNEEMQATTEELETLNEELQATVEELNTTNEELGARSHELERVARERAEELESARHTLDTLKLVVDHMPLAFCLIDKERNVVVASREYLRLAESNRGALPNVEERWHRVLKTLKLKDGKGDERTFTVEHLSLPESETDVMLILHPGSVAR